MADFRRSDVVCVMVAISHPEEGGCDSKEGFL